MGAEIATAVGVLIAAAAAYYSRQRALPEMTKRKVCQSLLRLRDALNAIAYTGQDIGQLMMADTFAPNNDAKLRDLIRLLEEQNANLRAAETEFKSLATVLEIQAPELHPLIIHIRGKSDRIELIYSVASTADVRRRLQDTLAPWEESRLLHEPRELTPVIRRSGEGDMRIEPIGRSREADEDFEEIVHCIPKLTEFIKSQCDPEYLM